MKRHLLYDAITFIVALIPAQTALAGSFPEALGTIRTSLAHGATYTISTEGELAHLIDLANGGEDCEGNYFLLMNDIVITGDHDASTAGNWTPIGYGDAAANFRGSFYGQNHTISGLDIRSNTFTGSGLFSFIGSGGIVLDLNVSGSMVHGLCAGGIAGVNDGMILNCTSGVAYTNGTSISTSYIGGIAGMC